MKLLPFSLSLRWSLMLTAAGISVVLVIAFAALSVFFFFRGMDNIVGADMESHARHVMQGSGNTSPLDWSQDWVTRDWAEIPVEVSKHFEKEPQLYQTLVEMIKRDHRKRPEAMLFAMRLSTADGDVYVVRRVNKVYASPLIGHNMRANQIALASAVLLSLLLVGLALWGLLHRYSRPVTRLVGWTRDLSHIDIKRDPPDFEYPELNEMARLIRQSVSDVKETLDREQRFLAHASHELRTPITVVRSNAALMLKLLDKSDNDDPRLHQVGERINRASLTMTHLTETLLWLSREGDPAPDAGPFHLASLIQEQLDDLAYLLHGKAVQVQSELDDSTVLQLPQVAARIVLANVIRNALQHTQSGTMHIVQQQAHITITNTLAEPGSIGTEIGFGLGLQVTRKLCERLGWKMVSGPDGDVYRVELVFKESELDNTTNIH